MHHVISVGILTNEDTPFYSYTERSDKDKTLQDIKNELSKVDPESEIIICGGEPAIRPDFFEIIELAKEFPKITLETNGRIFCYQDFCEKAIEAGINKFAVKLYSDNPLINDKIAGFKDSFVQTITGINNLKKLHQDIRIIITLCKKNYQHICDIVELVHKMKLEEIQIIFPESIPEGYLELEEIVPSIDQAIGFIDSAIELIKGYKMRLIPGHTPFTLCHYNSQRVKKGKQVSKEGFKIIYDNKVNINIKPIISVIIPTFNRSRILKNTIHSLYKQTLSHEAYELIVVDDGSTDDTEKMIKSLNAPFRMRFIVQNDLGYGPGRARNLGVKNADGDYILFLDADVLSDPKNLQEHLNCHKKEGDIVVIGRRLDMHNCELLQRIINDQTILSNFDAIKKLPMKGDMREDFFYWSDDEIHKFQTPWTMLYTNNISVKKKHFISAGLIDESFVFWSVEDQELGYRLGWLKFVLNRDAVGYHQPHEIIYKNHEGMNKAIKFNSRIFYKKYLDRTIYDMYHSFISYDKEEIKIEKRCSNECIFCEFIGKKLVSAPSLADIKKQILLAKGEGIKDIFLSGGDPLLNSQILSIVKFANDADSFKKIGLETPCCSVEPDLIKKLIKEGLSEFTLYICGPDGKTHDGITKKPGSFMSTIEAIKLINGLEQDIILKIFITKDNFIFIPEMVELAVALKIKKLNLIIPLALGENKHLFDETTFPISSVIFDYVYMGLKLAKQNKMDLTTDNVYSDFVALFNIQSKKMYGLFNKEVALSRGALR